MKVNVSKTGSGLGFEPVFFNNKELAEKLKQVKLSTEELVNPPSPCIKLKNENEELPIGTLGNFSLIIGKAKSRKTFFASLIVGSILNDYVAERKIIGQLPIGKKGVLYFDTEQSRYHAVKTINCIHQVAEKAVIEGFTGYCLRQFNPIERLKLIEYAIESTPNLGLVVIDGLRDLITAINDEGQATKLTSLLLKWSAERDIHIIGVLHENKGDNNARGHIGTELVNKAETVISVSIKNSGDMHSIVEPKYTRDKSFIPFYFTVSPNGTPEIIDSTEVKTSEKKKPEECSDEFYKKVLEKVYANESQLIYSKLWPLLKIELSNANVKIGNNKVQELLIPFVTKGLLLLKGNKYLLPEKVSV